MRAEAVGPELDPFEPADVYGERYCEPQIHADLFTGSSTAYRAQLAPGKEPAIREFDNRWRPASDLHASPAAHGVRRPLSVSAGIMAPPPIPARFDAIFGQPRERLVFQ